MDTIAVAAGAGELPLVVIEKIKQRGERAIILAFDGITDKDVNKSKDKIYWLRFGKLGELIDIFKRENVKKLIFSGGIDKRLLLEYGFFDSEAKRFLEGMKDKGDLSLLRTLSEVFKREGIELISPYIYLKPYLLGEGIVSERAPSASESKDIEFGWKIAKNIAHLDIGHAVVVKGGMIFAVESVEGTDAMILRGGKLAGGNAVVVKVARQHQDERFDHPPVIGLNTIKAASGAGISAIAFEAGKTIVLDKDFLVKECKSSDIALTGI